MVGDASWVNYSLTGLQSRLGWGTGRNFVQATLTRGQLAAPPGLEFFKYLIGQREIR